jgi:hypothetical protein
VESSGPHPIMTWKFGFSRSSKGRFRILEGICRGDRRSSPRCPERSGDDGLQQLRRKQRLARIFQRSTGRGCCKALANGTPALWPVSRIRSANTLRDGGGGSTGGTAGRSPRSPEGEGGARFEFGWRVPIRRSCAAAENRNLPGSDLDPAMALGRELRMAEDGQPVASGTVARVRSGRLPAVR